MATNAVNHRQEGKMDTSVKTKSQMVNEDITALLRARCTLFWIVTREEIRVEKAIIEAAAEAKYETLLWDCATGLSDNQENAVDRGLTDSAKILERIRDNTERKVYVLRDFHKWFDIMILRGVRSLARTLQASERESARSI